MLLQSILKILNEQFTQPKIAAAEKDTHPHEKVEGEIFSNIIDKVDTPASAATLDAAMEATGIKRNELEIAAAAGLLRPISSENPPTSNQSNQRAEELLKTIEELKKPQKSHNLDLFE